MFNNLDQHLCLRHAVAYTQMLIYISTPILSLAFSVFKPKILIFCKTTKDFLIVKTKCEFLDKIFSTGINVTNEV